MGKENADKKHAEEVSEKVWKIIEDSSSYLFCAAHAFAYSCDSAYGAWLKAHYPYEFYVTMLKLYTEKGNKEKVTAIIEEMRRYRGITLKPGQWGEDNSDWYIDKEHNTISQSMSSVKFISKKAAKDLYKLSQQKEAWIGTEFIKDKEHSTKEKLVYTEHKYYAPLNSFSNILRALQMNTCLDTRQIGILIGLDYFKQFGENQKLMNVFNEFFEGTNKLTKNIKSFNKRLTALCEYEKIQMNQRIPYAQQLKIENENMGLCFSAYPTADPNLFFVIDVDTTYGVKAKLYSVQRGTSGVVKMRKQSFAEHSFAPNQCILIDEGKIEQRCVYKGNKRVPIPGEKDYWLKRFHFPQPPATLAVPQ